MTTFSDGTTSCDRCGADLGNGSVNICVRLNVLDASWQPLGLHLGIAEGCAAAVLFDTDALGWRQTDPSSPGPVILYTPPTV